MYNILKNIPKNIEKVLKIKKTLDFMLKIVYNYNSRSCVYITTVCECFLRGVLMAVYSLSDLHLSLGTDKPMDVFGKGWHNYMERICANWQNTVFSGDTVIIGGDTSWAMYLNECYADFKMLNSLNGTKIILKGNHDYWWDSINKMTNYAAENGFTTLKFLHNTAYIAENIGIFGTRGWLIPASDNFKQSDRKIYERELVRLELSYSYLKKLCCDLNIDFSTIKPVAVLHYPPVLKDGTPDDGFAEFFEKNNIKNCIYGHLHADAALNSFNGTAKGTDYKLVSSDFLEFVPYKLNF